MNSKQMKLNVKWVSISAIAFALSSIGYGQSFTQADLEKMVRELEVHLPQDPRLTYPIRCVVETKDEVNAYASAYYDKSKGDKAKPQASMTVFTGLITKMKDLRLVRAVVAHELAHLSKQHLRGKLNASDLDLVLVRQQEYEADFVGAAVLEKAGYNRKDMIDMLNKLGEESKKVPGSIKVMGDHADDARRAANIDKSSLVLRSMVSFTNGEAYMDVRSYLKAMQSFDLAAIQAPQFYESKYNAALAALLNYYEQVDAGVKKNWFLPDFGPSLLQPVSVGKGGTITEGDRANYRIAQDRVRKVLDADSKRQESLIIQGTLLVLDPEGTAANIQAGITTLEAALKSEIIEANRLRIVNNLAVGYQRTGSVVRAMDAMMAEQRKTKVYNSFLAVNLGSQEFGDKFKDDSRLAEGILYTYLTRSSSAAAGYDAVMANYRKLCTKFNLKPREIKEQGINLCRVMSLTDGGTTFNLLDSVFKITDLLGKAENGTRYSEEYDGMMELVWNKGTFSILTEQRKFEDEFNLDILRVTSYNKGAYIDLKPTDTKINLSFRISVGMTEGQFSNILNPAGGVKRQLVKLAELEEWLYYPGLNMGVLMKDGKVAGITVTPSSD
jgi:tetratricopeptide (TPR) repeat protein